MDIVAVGFSSATAIVGLAVTLLALWSSDRRHLELCVFAISLLMIAAGQVMVVLMWGVSDFLSYVVGNLIIAAGTLGIWRGARTLVGKPPLHFIEIGAQGLFSALILYFTYETPSTYARAIIFALFLTFFPARASLDLFQDLPTRRSRAGWLIMGSLLTISAIFLLRLALILHSGTIDYWQGDLGDLGLSVIFIGPMGCCIGLALGVFWATFERIADELRSRNLALDAAREAAKQANQAKSAFLATMSHEIRTPMHGIIGCTDILIEMTPTAEQKPYLDMLRDAESLLLTIINDILDFSKIETAQFTLHSLPLELRPLIEGAIELIRGQASDKGLALSVEIDPALPDWIAGDSARLRQILLNLLGNAVKFTREGGISLDLALRGEQIRFTVSDTGIGIPPERQHLLFQDFTQVHHTGEFGGTGLGLAICKRLITAMGGAIGLNSDLGRGSDFWFTLPLVIADAPTPEAKTEPALMNTPGVRILVAEDVRVNQMIIERLLTSAGHQVTLVDDGAAALAAVRAQPEDAPLYDLLLMDMRMPRLDGVAATEAIRRLDHPARTIPIIGLTANATPQDAARCRAAGMNDHLIKPIDRTTLMRAIAQWATRVDLVES